MRRPLFVAAAFAAVVAIAVAGDRSTRAADHTDSPAATAAAALDLSDLYAWMTPDGEFLNLVLTVNPLGAVKEFDTDGQYVFHIASGAAFGEQSQSVEIIIEFQSQTDAQVWVGDDMSFRGDPSDPDDPLTPGTDEVRVFAGTRADPFFFNLTGFAAAVDTVHSEVTAGNIEDADEDGCPELSGAQSNLLTDQLTGVDPEAVNDFAGQDVSAIVVQIDVSLVNGGGDFLSAYASTHTQP